MNPVPASTAWNASVICLAIVLVLELWYSRSLHYMPVTSLCTDHIVFWLDTEEHFRSRIFCQ